MRTWVQESQQGGSSILLVARQVWSICRCISGHHCFQGLEDMGNESGEGILINDNS